jgi:ABC-2 type transport system ATP-binding protein
MYFRANIFQREKTLGMEEYMIEVKHLEKRYGSNIALNNVSFKIEENEVVGFLGPNGAGKSTTMNIITGYLSATSGTVTIQGKDILDNPSEAKAMIGYLPELPPLYPDMTVEEYLNFIYELKKVKLPKKEHIEEVCSITKITNVYKRLIGNLSKGYRQRVGIAQALIGNPPLLILDEPTVGLDPKQIIEIRTLIKKLGKKHTVILSSHILPEVQAVCERILILNQGTLVADGTEEELSRKLSKNRGLVLRIKGPEDEILRSLKYLDAVKSATSYGEKEKGVFEFVVNPKEGKDIREDVFFLLAKNGWPMYSIKDSEMTLEDVFLHLTSTDTVVSINDDIFDDEDKSEAEDDGDKDEQSDYDDEQDTEAEKDDDKDSEEGETK